MDIKDLQECLDKLIDEIIELEEEIKTDELNLKKHESEQNVYINDYDKDIAENNSRIKHILKCRENEKIQYDKDINKKEEEVREHIKRIKLIENEIIRYKSKFKEDERSNREQNQNIDQIKNKKCSLDEKAKSYNSKLLEITNDLSLLKEHKNRIKEEVVNMISKNESLEEFIKNELSEMIKVAAGIRTGDKELINKIDKKEKEKGTYGLIDREIKIDKEQMMILFPENNNEINNFDKKNNENVDKQSQIKQTEELNKTSHSLIKLFLKNFPLINYKDRNILNKGEKIIQDSLTNYKTSKHISVDDFFILLGTKIHTLIKDHTNNVDNMIAYMPIYLKYIFKYKFSEEIIKSQLIFLQKEYEVMKEDIITKKKEYEIKSKLVSDKVEKLKVKESVAKMNFDNNKDICYTSPLLRNEDMTSNEVIKKLDLKLHCVEVMKSETEKEKNQMQQLYRFKQSNNEEHLHQLEKLNEDLNYRKDHANPKLFQIKQEMNTEMNKKKKRIEENQRVINSHINNYNYGNGLTSSKSDFIKIYVSNLNLTKAIGKKVGHVKSLIRESNDKSNNSKNMLESYKMNMNNDIHNENYLRTHIDIRKDKSKKELKYHSSNKSFDDSKTNRAERYNKNDKSNKKNLNTNINFNPIHRTQHSYSGNMENTNKIGIMGNPYLKDVKDEINDVNLEYNDYFYNNQDQNEKYIPDVVKNQSKKSNLSNKNNDMELANTARTDNLSHYNSMKSINSNKEGCYAYDCKIGNRASYASNANDIPEQDYINEHNIGSESNIVIDSIEPDYYNNIENNYGVNHEDNLMNQTCMKLNVNANPKSQNSNTIINTNKYGFNSISDYNDMKYPNQDRQDRKDSYLHTTGNHITNSNPINSNTNSNNLGKAASKIKDLSNNNFKRESSAKHFKTNSISNNTNFNTNPNFNYDYNNTNHQISNEKAFKRNFSASAMPINKTNNTTNTVEMFNKTNSKPPRMSFNNPIPKSKTALVDLVPKSPTYPIEEENNIDNKCNKSPPKIATFDKINKHEPSLTTFKDYKDNREGAIYSNTATVLNPKDKNNIKKKATINFIDNFKQEINFHYEKCTNEDFSFLEKIRPLLEGSIIYKRTNMLGNQKLDDYCYYNSSKFKSNSNNLNPNSTNSSPNCPESFGFEKNFMYIDKRLERIIFEKVEKPSRIVDLKFSFIEKTIVTQTTKNIISVHQIYRKLKKQKKDPEIYFGENVLKCNEDEGKVISKENRIKYLNTKKFLLYVVLINGVRIEIILHSYEEFKYWVNGFAMITKGIELGAYKDKIVE